MHSKDHKSEVEILRQKAEDLLKWKPANFGSLITETDPLKLMHDLEVNQIALEMQNIELRQAVTASQDAIELYDFAPIGYFTLSREGEIKNVNLFGAQMLGSTTARLKKSQFEFYVSNAARPAFNKFLKDVFGKKTKEKCNLILLANDNFPVYVQIIGIVNKTGDQCLVTAADVSELKRAQDTLAQTHKNFETFFDTIHDFLFVLDLQGRMIQVNETVISRLGYTRKELSGKSFLMIHSPEHHNEASTIFSKILSGVTNFYPIPVMTKSGIKIPVETRAAYGNWDGRPAIVRVSKDVSKLALSEEKFSKLFYINPSACGLTDLNTGKYVEVNEAFYSLLGFNKDEVIGRTPVELGIFTGEDVKAIIDRSIDKQTTHNIDADLRTKTGEVRHVLLSSEVIEVQDVKLRYTVVHDITDRLDG
jgi:PAS domain S-box-containing protein